MSNWWRFGSRPRRPFARRSFLKQRAPRRGQVHPERMQMPVWEWLIREGISAYEINALMRGPDPIEAGPGFSFMRFGCSETTLPDGRVVHIGGEHEDHYDPDFYIYNDVIVRGPGDEIEIFGYPEAVFPPTDMHSATLVDERILIVGCLGYPKQRRFGHTPVYALDPRDWRIQPRHCSGDSPGWIWKHHATLAEDGSTLRIERGTVSVAAQNGEMHTDNIDLWELCTQSWRWTRQTTLPWQQWRVRRIDQQALHLWQMSMAAFEVEHPALREHREADPESRKWSKKFGIELDPAIALANEGLSFEPGLWNELYAVPEGATLCEGDSDGYPELEFEWQGARVRVRDDNFSMEVFIVGDLDQELARGFADTLASRLSALHGAPCEAHCERSAETEPR
jgi:hypothetical protein